VFASLLDATRVVSTGSRRTRDDYVSRHLYLHDTALLITPVHDPRGWARSTTFMPVIEGPATGRHRLVRNLRVSRGHAVQVEIPPRFDYGPQAAHLRPSTHGGVFPSEDLELTAHAIAPRCPPCRTRGSTRSATLTGCGDPDPGGRASPGEWS